MRQELKFRGRLQLGEGDPRTVEVWETGGTAVAFDGGQQLAVLRGVQRRLTDDGRIVFTGTDPDGAAVTWEGPDAPQVTVRWTNARVAWPEGGTWTAAEVSATQYGVRVTAPGLPPMHLPGARLEVTGSQRWIVDGATRVLADSPARSGCGCGG